MSSKVVGRGRCPRCGREGSVVLKEIGGRVYVYVKHGREWHYIGPLEEVDLRTILYHSSTTKTEQESKKIIGISMSSSELKRWALRIGGIILILIGILLVVGPIFGLLFYTLVGVGYSLGGKIVIDPGQVYVISLSKASKLTVECSGCSFRYCFDCLSKPFIEVCRPDAVTCRVNRSLVIESTLSKESYRHKVFEPNDIDEHKYVVVVPNNYPATVSFDMVRVVATASTTLYALPVLLFPFIIIAIGVLLIILGIKILKLAK